MRRADQGLGGGGHRYTVQPRTLCFVERDGEAEPEVLLLRGSHDKRLWANQHNGVGGHVEQGEDIGSAAARELLEETGLVVDDLSLRAIVHVDVGSSCCGVLIFVFLARYRPGEWLRPCPEGDLHWVPRSQVMDLNLVEDLRELLPRLWSRSADDGVLYGCYRFDAADRLVMEWSE